MQIKLLGLARLLALLLLAGIVPGVAMGQAAFRKDGSVIGPTGQAIAGTSIAVCTQPAITTTTPCSPLATLYADSTATVYSISAISCSANVVRASTSVTNFIPVGQWVTISGVTNPSFNGTFQVTSQAAGTVTWNQSCTNGSSSGGAISGANPTFTNGLGNYFIYTSSAVYTFQAYGNTVSPPLVFQDQNVGLTGVVSATNLAGPGTVTGNYTHSGTETFANINKTVYVDGVTYATISAAVTAACNGTTPGVVVISPGTWSFSSSITVPSHCTISGPRAAIVAPTSNFGAFTSTSALTDVTFDGFTLQTSGINLQGNSDHIAVRNVKFSNTGSTSVSIAGTVGNPGTSQASIDITNNVCESPATFFCFAVGQDVQPNAGTHDIHVSGNNMSGCAGDCIIVQGAKGVRINDNTINLCGDTCIESGIGNQVVSIVGNTVDISASTSLNIVGISTRSNQNATVSGNTVIGNSGSSGTQNCLLAWHSSGDGQAEQYFTYVGNNTAGCTVGLKTFQANHFTIGGNDHQNNATPVSIDTTGGGATDWVELPSRNDNSVVLPALGNFYGGGNKNSTSAALGFVGSLGNPILLAPSNNFLFANNAPTISPASGFNTGTIDPTPNGTATFLVTIGAGTANSTGTLNFTAGAAHGWNCQASNQTRAALISQTANSTTSSTLTNYGTTFAATNWTNGDVLIVICEAR